VRLAAGLLVVCMLALPAYFLLLDPAKDGSIAPARLLMTPPIGARTLEVGVEQGRLAPDFDISTPDGARVSLSQLRGQPVVINFWARWCTSCLTEMPELKSLQEERGVDAVTVFAVNAGERPAEAQEFIDFLDAPFVYGLDTDLTVTDAYGVYGLPLSVFIDSEGVVQGVYTGHASRQTLTMLTDAAIEARPAGPIPPVLRLISTIFRERTVDVTPVGGDRVRIESRSLRCDASYCASEAVDELRRPALVVEFDPTVLDPSAVAEMLVGLLERIPDPVYRTEFIVRYGDAPR
jgi:peroxiredoxin